MSMPAGRGAADRSLDRATTELATRIRSPELEWLCSLHNYSASPGRRPASALAVGVPEQAKGVLGTPRIDTLAVSRNAVENAVSAGAAELAPAEITAARDKMVRANQALAARDYRTARELAIQAQADAKLAQSKANSAKATAAANALDEDLRVLRQEVDRANAAAPAPAATTSTQ